MPELPPILQGEALQQIAQLRDYLVRRERGRENEILQTVTANPETVRKAVSSAGTTQGNARRYGEGAETDAARRAAALRALIVKTADESRAGDLVLTNSIGELSHELRQEYLARSEFGEYRQEIALLIEATARQIVESYGYLEQIRATEAELGEMGEAFAAYTTEISGQIRRGFLEDPETHLTVLGIAISQQLQFTGQELTDGGRTYYELSPGQTLGLYTSTGWQFWVNGRKVGWFDSSDGMLHTVSQVVEQELRLGSWSISAAGGLGIRMTGA